MVRQLQVDGNNISKEETVVKSKDLLRHNLFESIILAVEEIMLLDNAVSYGKESLCIQHQHRQSVSQSVCQSVRQSLYFPPLDFLDFLDFWHEDGL